MSEGINAFHLGGNVCDDPRHPADGRPLVIRIAANRRYVQQGEVKEATDYLSVTVWGARGEALAKILRKGEAVFVEGFVSSHSWGEGDQRRYETVLTATKVVLTGKRKEEGNGSPKNKGK